MIFLLFFILICNAELKVKNHIMYIPDKESTRRRLGGNYCSNLIWKKDSNILNITVGDCHNPSSINWHNMLTDVIYNWNNIPKNQDGSNRKSPQYISINKIPISDFYCNNDIINPINIRSYNGNYGFQNEWHNVLGMAKLYYNTNNQDKYGRYYISYVKIQINEYYFNRGYSYNQWQQVLCHEIGHGLPLDHQSEDGSDQNSCMDYSKSLDNKYPDYEDLDILDRLYEPNASFFQTDCNFENVINWYLVILVILLLILLIIIGFIIKNIYFECCNKEEERNEGEE